MPIFIGRRNARILIAAVAASFIAPIAFAQMTEGPYGPPQSQPPQPSGGIRNQTQTTTKTAMPVGVKGYLDGQMSSSKDKKFHVTLNGKDLVLTPVKFHQEKKLGGGKAMQGFAVM